MFEARTNNLTWLSWAKAMHCLLWCQQLLDRNELNIRKRFIDTMGVNRAKFGHEVHFMSFTAIVFVCSPKVLGY